MSQRVLAVFLGSSEQNISLWERRGRIPQTADRLIKLAYLETISKDGNVQIRALIERLNALDATVHQGKMKFQKIKEWKEAA